MNIGQVDRPPHKSIEKLNYETIQLMVHAFSNQDIASIKNLFAENAVYQDMLGSGLDGKEYRNRSEIVSHFELLFKWLPSHHYEDQKIIVSGEFAHANWVMVLGSKLPSNRQFRVRGCDYFVLENGKVVIKQAWIKNLVGLALAIVRIRVEEFFVSKKSRSAVPEKL